MEAITPDSQGHPHFFGNVEKLFTRDFWTILVMVNEISNSRASSDQILKAELDICLYIDVDTQNSTVG